MSLVFGCPMSERGLKDAERGGPEPDTDLSFFDEHWVFGVRICGSEHLWSSILEP